MAIFYHGSSVLFSKFDLAHALEGDGKVKFGYGVYLTSSFKSAAHYSGANKSATTHYVYTVEVPELTEDNHRQFFISKGFAHGFAVLSETAVFQYKCDEFYHPEADGGISIMDQSLGINWKIPTDQALLSEKDTKHQMLVNFDSPFNINTNLYIESETR